MSFFNGKKRKNFLLLDSRGEGGFLTSDKESKDGALLTVGWACNSSERPFLHLIWVTWVLLHYLVGMP